MSDRLPEEPEQPGLVARTAGTLAKAARRFYDWAGLAGTASAVATLVVLIATLVGETTAELMETYRNFPALVEPWWTRAILFVPLPVWWLLTVVFSVAAWVYCRRLADERESIWPLFVPPVLLYVLSLLAGWALYSPIKSGF